MLNRRTAFLALSVAVLVTTPTQAQYHIYWGDMHGHTNHTGGKGTDDARFEYVDEAFGGNSDYCVRVIQADKDEHGNRSHAWSSPIWVENK